MIPSSLDELFAEARSGMRRAAEAKSALPAKKTVLKAEVVEPAALFTNPDNWIKGVGVALIHEETDTLLGNFIEYTHKSERGCRKLVLEEGLLSVSKVERVAGDWWVAARHTEIARREESSTKHTVILPTLDLDKLGVRSPICEVVVHLVGGLLSRVELATETLFAGESPEQLLSLPAGTNLIAVMSRDCKVQLRLEIDKGTV